MKHKTIKRLVQKKFNVGRSRPSVPPQFNFYDDYKVWTIKVNRMKKEGSTCSPQEHVLEQEH